MTTTTMKTYQTESPVCNHGSVKCAEHTTAESVGSHSLVPGSVYQMPHGECYYQAFLITGLSVSLGNSCPPR